MHAGKDRRSLSVFWSCCCPRNQRVYGPQSSAQSSAINLDTLSSHPAFVTSAWPPSVLLWLVEHQELLMRVARAGHFEEIVSALLAFTALATSTDPAEDAQRFLLVFGLPGAPLEVNLTPASVDAVAAALEHFHSASGVASWVYVEAMVPVANEMAQLLADAVAVRARDTGDPDAATLLALAAAR